MGSLAEFQASIRGCEMSTTTTCTGNRRVRPRGPRDRSTPAARAAGSRPRTHLDVGAAGAQRGSASARLRGAAASGVGSSPVATAALARGPRAAPRCVGSPPEAAAAEMRATPDPARAASRRRGQEGPRGQRRRGLFARAACRRARARPTHIGAATVQARKWVAPPLRALPSRGCVQRAAEAGAALGRVAPRTHHLSAIMAIVGPPT